MSWVRLNIALAMAVAMTIPVHAAEQAKPVSAIGGPILTFGKGGLESEEARLARANFAPIAEAAKTGATIRRLTVRDVFDSPTSPNIVLEKAADGKITYLMTTSDGNIRETGALTAAEWQSVIDLDGALAPRKDGPIQVKGQVCHAKLMVIETADAGKTRRRESSLCAAEADAAALRYAYKMAEVVVNHIPRCRASAGQNREPTWSLTDCYKEDRRRRQPADAD